MNTLFFNSFELTKKCSYFDKYEIFDQEFSKKKRKNHAKEINVLCRIHLIFWQLCLCG